MAASKEEIDRAAGSVSLVLAAERDLWPDDEQTLRAAVNVLMKLGATGARSDYR